MIFYEMHCKAFKKYIVYRNTKVLEIKTYNLIKLNT